MKAVSTSAIAASLIVTGLAIGSPADAQRYKAARQAEERQAKKQGVTVEVGGRKLALSAEGSTAIAELQTAINAGDSAAVAGKLAAANAAAKNDADKYIIAKLHLQHATKINDTAQQAAAIDAVIATGLADANELAILQRNAAILASRSGDEGRAAAALAALAEANPNDADTLANLAAVKINQKQPAEALPLLNRAIAAKKSAGQPVPEAWYRNALQLAHNAKMRPQAMQLSREVVAAYPSSENWRNGILIYRQGADLDPAARLDSLRLMRATKSLDSADEYLLLADQLARGGYYAEAKAVLDEAAAAGKVPAGNSEAAAIVQEVSGKIAGDRAALPGLEARARSAANGTLAVRVADGYYGHGNYAKAAEFYRVALQKGAVDANIVNTRLGMALALAGQKAEAEAAFKAINGPRADLASYWMLWLNQRG